MHLYKRCCVTAMRGWFDMYSKCANGCGVYVARCGLKDMINNTGMEWRTLSTCTSPPHHYYLSDEVLFWHRFLHYCWFDFNEIKMHAILVAWEKTPDEFLHICFCSIEWSTEKNVNMLELWTCAPPQGPVAVRQLNETQLHTSHQFLKMEITNFTEKIFNEGWWKFFPGRFKFPPVFFLLQSIQKKRPEPMV